MHKGSSSDLLSELVPAAVIARAVGLSARRVTQLRDEHKLPGATGGKFPLGAAALAHCDLLRRIRPEASDDVDLDRERALLARAQRDGHLMKNARTSGQQIDLSSAEAAYGAVVDNTRAGFLALPTRAAPRLLGLTDHAEMVRR